jgi:hypothetical protein
MRLKLDTPSTLFYSVPRGDPTLCSQEKSADFQTPLKALIPLGVSAPFTDAGFTESPGS